MREMKDSGIEWIGEIPKTWTITILSALFSERKCKNSGLAENNLLSLSYGNIVRKNIESNEGLLPASFETYNIIEPGNIVFRLTDLQNDKRSLRTGLCKERGIITSAYVTLQIRSDDSPHYMHYLFHTYDLCKVFYGMGDGVRQGMNYEDLKRLRILRPDQDTQRRIADYLDHKCSQINTIIARQQQVIEKLKAYKLSVITEAVTKGLNPDVPMKDSRVECIGEVPGNWTKVKLKNICQFINGDRSSNYPSPNEYVDNGIPFLGADSLCGRYVDVTQSKKITKEKYHSMGGAKIQKGDILYTLRGSTIGKNAIATFDEGTVASSLMVIRPISLIPEYLLYWLNSEEEFQQRQSYINGSTAPNLSAENVGSFVMFLPPALEQREIADYLDTKCAEIELTMLKKQVLIDQLGNYKKSLIYEVVTGKKEV